MARVFQTICTLSLLSLILFINEASAQSAQHPKVILFGDQTLTAPLSLDNDRFTFVMQDDCNFVLYSSGKPIWASGTYGRGSGCKVTLQSDGNLALFTRSGQNIWNSNTRKGRGTYQLIMQDDGNAVIYSTETGAIWATNTYGQSKEISLTK